MKQTKKKKAEGLGDTIADFTHLLKLDKLVKSLTESIGIEDCGCTRRQKKLNELFPYKKCEDKKLD